MSLNRRDFLGAAAAGAAATTLVPGLAGAAAPQPASLHDIEHIVVLMLENRSFDEYFGTMSGVIGFDDPNAVPGVFEQHYPVTVQGQKVDMSLLPWHMDSTTTNSQGASDLNHSWGPQHQAWDDGKMDQFVAAQSTTTQTLTMGYFTRADLPFHFSLADNFTILDRYHCSQFGPTWPNRLYLMSGTVNPAGDQGGPITANNPSAGQLTWESFPETLQKAGVDWRLYQESDNYGCNMLPLFAAFQDTSTDLYKRGNSVIPGAASGVLGQGIANQLAADAANGVLPQVAYVVGPQVTSEHPTSTPGRGAQFIGEVYNALTSVPEVWAKTLLIVNYDENDGHWDHVLPPTPPAGTKDEFITVSGSPSYPIGLGFRVPCILVSPFTTGGLVCSDIFDHTSVIQLMERKFNVRCPNISDWRRATVGDLTSAINFSATPSATAPTLYSGDAAAATAASEANYPPPVAPLRATQTMPTQESTPTRARPSGLIAAAPPASLPEAGVATLLPAAALVAGAATIAVRNRRGGAAVDLAAEEQPSAV